MASFNSHSPTGKSVRSAGATIINPHYNGRGRWQKPMMVLFLNGLFITNETMLPTYGAPQQAENWK
jgi:hypothetical protein